MKANILQQAYPFNTSLRKEVIGALLFGLFIFLFLIVFQPFGLQYYESEHKTWQLLTYGLITTSALLVSNSLFKWLLPKWYSKKTWTVGKNMLYTFCMFFLIGSANLLYSVYLGFLPLTLKGFLHYQGLTLLIGSFPVIISTLIVHQNRLKNALKEANTLNQTISKENTLNNELITIPSKNKSEELKLKLNQLLFIKSVENYIEVYCEGEKGLEKHILRNTLKEIETALSPYPKIKRCHRSYLINLKKVASFSGNAQGLSIQLNSTSKEDIPVSRSYVAEIKKVL
ncbi:MAG: LytTR family DNA-binding domain-containing protein [Vicingaceae bacterium]